GDHAAAQVDEEADRRAEGSLEGLDRLRGRVPAALVVHPAETSPAPGGPRLELGPEPDRPLRAGEAGAARAAARARGGPEDARPPAQPRPDRPAAGRGRRRGLRERPRPRRL